jgi:hypothetical protein
MAATTQSYHSSHVAMLLIGGIILKNALEIIVLLQDNDTSITPQVIADLKKEIDNNLDKFLGTDKAQKMRAATVLLQELQSQATTALQFMKERIEVKYREDVARRNEILNELGYHTFDADVKNKDQEALVQLLFRYQNNMSKQLKDELKLKGIPEAKIDAPLTFAQAVSDANTNQEFEKEQKVQMTDELQKELNTIYGKYMDIAKLATSCLKNDKVKQRQFSFNHLHKNMGQNKPNEDKPDA